MFAEKLPRRPMRSLIAIKRYGAQQSAVTIESAMEKRFGRPDISLGAEGEIHRLSLLVHRSIEVGPTAFDLHIGLIDAPRGVSPVGEAVPAFFEILDIALEPAHDHRMSQCYAPLSHHFHEISKAELEPEIPAYAQDDDLPVEMAAFEKIIHVQQPGTRPQKAS